MKTLSEMHNIDRAYLLANLFPDQLKDLTEYMKKEADFFENNREQIFKNWTERHITAEFWFSLITDFRRSYLHNGTRLYRNKRTFRDQLFDGYNSLFAIHCLIAYSGNPNCGAELKQAIHLLFGSKKFLVLTLND